MASCGGVGGNNNNGSSNSVGGSGASNSVGNSSSDSGKTSSVGTNDSGNETAKANNTEGANAKNGIDREAQQKADLNCKMDAAQTDQQTEQAKTEQVKAEQVKADQVKTEQINTEQVKAAEVQAQSFTDMVKEKAKEVMTKAAEVAKTVKEEVDKALEKVQKQKDLAELARNPKVAAMLDTLGFTEGTGLNYGKVVNGTVIGQNKKNMGYDTTLTSGMTNVSTLDMSQHPNVKVQVNKNLVSSAAGRYQFLSGTWNSLSQKLGLTNFYASTQDLAAVQLMKERNMIQPLLDGDLKTAVNRGANEWASLPKADGNGVYAGQNARSFEAIERAYNDFLKDAEWRAQAGDLN